jgi:hypothetical protein
MRLRYLSFDYAEGTDGTGTLEAMASTWPEQVQSVQAEVVQVLAWAHAEFPGRRGSLEEGLAWDYDLQGLLEFTAPQALHYDETARRLVVEAGLPGKPRHTLTLSLSGTAEFCDAFKRQFGLDAD